MANHRGVKFCKAKGQYAENRTANVRMSRTVFTDLYTHSRTSQSEGIPDPGIPERPFVIFANRRSLASSRRAFFVFLFFFRAVFSALRAN